MFSNFMHQIGFNALQLCCIVRFGTSRLKILMELKNLWFLTFPSWSRA